MKAEFNIAVKVDTVETFDDFKERMDDVLGELRQTGDANIIDASITLDKNELEEVLEAL